MAFAAQNMSLDLTGYFIEKTSSRPFEYRKNPESVLLPDLTTGRNTTYPHLVFVGPQGDQTRMAFVKKTVAYVVVDETDAGYVIEKWAIKGHRAYSR